MKNLASSAGRTPSFLSPGAERGPPAFARALLLLASAIASGTVLGETGSIDDGSNGTRDEGVSSTAPDRRTLKPRWIEPRRLENVSGADTGKRDVAGEASPEAAASAGKALPPRSTAEREALGQSSPEPPASALPAVVGAMARQPLSTRVVTSDADGDGDWRRMARIVIHGERVSDELSTLTADLLRKLGAETVERRRVGASSDVDQIRYFDAADEHMARALAAALEPEFGRVPIRDFTAYRPSPSSGLLEMWLR